MAEKTRRFAMEFTPKVTPCASQDVVIVTTGEWRHGVKFEMTGKLSMWCAAQLVRELRRAMRQVRDQKTATLNECVNNAEGAL